MRAQGQTFQPITGQSGLQACSAARINLDINAFKISENCIPCDFLTFQKSTLLFLSLNRNPRSSILSLKELFLWTLDLGSKSGFDARCRDSVAAGLYRPKPRRLASKCFNTAARFLISWWQISQNCDPKICRHPPSWIFLTQGQGPEGA